MRGGQCNLYLKSIIITSAILFLASCAGGGAVQISKKDLNSIKSITIDPEIKQPEIPFIQGAYNFGAFLAGGGIGVAISQNAAGKVFKEYMDRNNIDIAKIAYDEFKNIIIEDKIFPLKDESDIKLKLTINTYGFGKAGAFSGGDRRPLINITAFLVKNSGDTIWRKKDYITNLSKLTDTYTFDQLAENPQLTRRSFQQATNILARQILIDLNNIN